MPAYEVFAKFYDAVMGDGSEASSHLTRLIQAAQPAGNNLLELGCGTGSVLQHLQHDYRVSGVDLSSAMLSVARRKVPKAKLFRQNMVDFKIADQFDVVCCVYDTINHVQRFSQWKRLFANVCRRLAPGGCFIFDINTQRKLQRVIAAPPWVHRFEKNLLIIDVTALPTRLPASIPVPPKFRPPALSMTPLMSAPITFETAPKAVLAATRVTKRVAAFFCVTS